MKLWRSRQTPVLEGKWACSRVCLQDLVKTAILRELAEPNFESSDPVVHHHRLPVGLILLSRGAITKEQLRKALAKQRNAGTGRLGEWLVREGAIDEEQLTRALSAQWNCPVLASSPYDPDAMTAAFPRLMTESLGAVPLRISGRKLMYVAFEDRIDRCFVLALQRIVGLRVEAGLLPSSEFRRVREGALRATYPKTRLLEAANTRSLVHAVTAMLEERRAICSRIVRVHDLFWLRIWRRAEGTEDNNALPAITEVEDMVCSVSSGKGGLV